MIEQPRTEFRCACDRTRVCLAVLLFAMFTTGVSSQPSGARQDKTEAAKPTATDIAPRGKRDVKDVTYGDWRKVCFRPGGAKLHCRTSITGTFPTGQMAVRLDIVEREGDGSSRLQLFVPVGMYLQNPVKLTVDKAPPHLIPYTWCLTNACIAAALAKPKMIKEMSSGTVLHLEFVDSNLLSLTTSLPLGQFATVHKGMPAQTFEQDIDE